MERTNGPRSKRKGRKGVIAFVIWLALVMGSVAGLLFSFPRIRTFTSINDYDHIRDGWAANPAIAPFPPAGTAFPPGSAFRARIVPMQGADDIWLFIPGSAAAPAHQASGQPLSDRALSQARTALGTLAPHLNFDASSVSITLLFEEHLSFTVLWQDHATGDRLFVALID
jgi:hypothetical protein